jgi:hypothetical protein
MDWRARAPALLALAAWIAFGLWWPGPGADYANLRRANLVLSLAAAAIVLGRHRGLVRTAGQEKAALAALAAVSLAVYTNVFTFRIHYHEFAHYYLGSKYFRELGYGTLYAALLRAEAEASGGPLAASEARDLAVTGGLAPAPALLARSQAVKDAFTSERWRAFAADAAFLRQRLGEHYATVLRDHGFNASPLWAALGGALANRVPPGSHAGLRVLAVLDPLLLAGTFAAVGRVFGVRGALLALIHFCVVYGATFEWVGGAFLRYMWFSATALALCAFARARPGLGGALLGFAAALRVFPALFLAAIVLGAAPGAVRSRRVPPEAARAGAGFAAAVLLLLALTAATSPGLAAWPAFAENLARHASAPLSNLVGLTSAASTLLVSTGAVAEAETLGSILRALRFVAWPTAALAAAWAARRRSLAGAAVLGIPLVFAGLNLTAYYYAFLVLLTLVEQDRPAIVAGAFAVEAATYALSLVEGGTAVLFAWRSLLLLALLAAWLFAQRTRRVPAVGAATS